MTSKGPGPIVSGLFFEFDQVEPSAAFTEFSLEMHATRRGRETFSIPATWSVMISLKWREAELVMNSRITDDSEQMDRKTSRSICDAVGEQLQQNLRPEFCSLSSH